MANRTFVRTGNETLRSGGLPIATISVVSGAVFPHLHSPRHFTGQEQYARHAAQLIRVWFLDPSTQMTPNLRFGQGIPGIAEGRAAGVTETRLLVDIIDGVRLLQESSAWSSSDDAGLKDWMRAYVKWLRESSFGRDEATRGNNQETWYDAQVAALALYTGQPEVARQILKAARASIDRQFEPTGAQPRELAHTRVGLQHLQPECFSGVGNAR